MTSKKLALAWCMAAVLAACGSSDGDPATGPGDAAADAASAVDTGTETVAPDEIPAPSDTAEDDTPKEDTAAPDDAPEPGDTEKPACTGSAPECYQTCGGDYILGPAVCQAGAWVCEAGTLMDDCPPTTCWGAPLPGEKCNAGAWVCEPQGFAYEQCPELMCATCDGFAGPVTESGCTCVCAGGAEVHCTKAPPDPGCAAGGSSSLPGAQIEVSSKTCKWTLAEAAAGLSIEYQVVIAADVPGVVPAPQDGGQCEQPHKSGLILHETLAGAGQKYCICDSGLCMGPDETPVTLKAGTYPGTFQWDGKNWEGPSDTGNPKGAPFPAGTYTLTVSAKGKAEMPGGTGPFEVLGTFEVTLVE